MPPKKKATETPEQMRDYFNRRYSSDNTIVAASGRIDFDQLVDQVERWCGSWPKGKPGRDHGVPEFASGEIEVDIPETHQRYIMLMRPGVGVGDDDKYPLTQALRILGDQEGSTFFWSLVDKGLAEEATMHLDTRDGCGEIVATIVCPPDRGQEVEDIVRREMNRVRETIDEDGLLRSRAKIATAAMLASEQPLGRMTRIGSRWSYGLPYRTLEEEISRIDAVDHQCVIDCLDRYDFDDLLAVRGGGTS